MVTSKENRNTFAPLLRILKEKNCISVCKVFVALEKSISKGQRSEGIFYCSSFIYFYVFKDFVYLFLD